MLWDSSSGQAISVHLCHCSVKTRAVGADSRVANWRWTPAHQESSSSQKLFVAIPQPLPPVRPFRGC